MMWRLNWGELRRRYQGRVKPYRDYLGPGRNGTRRTQARFLRCFRDSQNHHCLIRPFVIATAFWGYILLFMLPAAPQRHTALIALALAAVVVQTVSPWKERVAILKKKVRLPASARAGRVA